jgi:hypothetical protein
MHRGKLIGAIVLVMAVGLVFALRPADQDSAPVSESATGRPQQAPPESAQEYSVDSVASEVYLRIYAAGALAALGHNHIISAGEFSGRVFLAEDPAESQWNLSFPVDAFVVDDPDLRARYGEDFESVPSDNDRSGTKGNMLSDSLLSGGAFPEIRFSGTGLTGTLGNAQLPVSIEIAGGVVEAVFPASITMSEGELVIIGEYRMTHEDLGLTPFTAMAGAMAVADEIDFTYRIRAVAGGQ